VIAAAVLEVLTTDVPLAALVAERIAMGYRVQGEAIPACSYDIGTIGFLHSDRSTEETTVTVRGHAVDVPGARTVAQAAAAAIEGQAIATLIGSTGVRFRASHRLSETFADLEPGDGDEALPAEYAIDLYLAFSET
jgi:hypothetical protein